VRDGKLKTGDVMLTIGDVAPDFELASHKGGRVRLADLLGARRAVLAFHPFAWTPV
jgi:peroxiredoxin